MPGRRTMLIQPYKPSTGESVFLDSFSRRPFRHDLLHCCEIGEEATWMTERILFLLLLPS